MQAEKISLTVNGEVKEPLEVILREGQAEPIVLPEKYLFTGTIQAPRIFSKTIKDKSLTVVEYSFAEKKLTIKVNPTDKLAAEVRGRIETNPDLLEFKINQDKYIDSKKLINHVRKYAHCFKTMDEAKELIKSLQNFEIKFEQTHVRNDDRKGNSEESVKNAIKYHKGEVKTLLELSMPLFVGAPKVDFTVEIEIDREGTTPVFGFYSIDLEVLIRQQVEELIFAEVAELQSEFTCLQLS